MHRTQDILLYRGHIVCRAFMGLVTALLRSLRLTSCVEFLEKSFEYMRLSLSEPLLAPLVPEMARGPVANAVAIG